MIPRHCLLLAMYRIPDLVLVGSEIGTECCVGRTRGLTCCILTLALTHSAGCCILRFAFMILTRGGVGMELSLGGRHVALRGRMVV